MMIDFLFKVLIAALIAFIAHCVARVLWAHIVMLIDKYTDDWRLDD